MYLTHLSLTYYRNYTRLEADLQARVHVLSGANAQGKTNLLESIYYLATTKSPLASSDRELLSWAAEGEPLPYARVEGAYQRGGQEHTLGATIMLEPPEAGAEQGVLRRQLRVDGVARRAMDAVGQLNVVLFLPEDINLVTGAPGGRRRYLDITLCQIDPAYCRALSRYNRVVTQRNALLRQVRDGRPNGPQRDYWDAELVRLGTLVLARRQEAVATLDRLAATLHPALTGAEETLSLRYCSTVARGAAASASGEEAFRQALAAARREETARGVTVVGPHRDDLRFLINGRDATIYGSRGQQRSVALSLKLAEVGLMRAATGESPVLLLDDVLSELDRTRARHLLATITRAEQVLLTTTDLHTVDPAFLQDAVLWEVAAGTLQASSPPQA